MNSIFCALLVSQMDCWTWMWETSFFFFFFLYNILVNLLFWNLFNWNLNLFSRQLGRIRIHRAVVYVLCVQPFTSPAIVDKEKGSWTVLLPRKKSKTEPFSPCGLHKFVLYSYSASELGNRKKGQFTLSLALRPVSRQTKFIDVSEARRHQI